MSSKNGDAFTKPDEFDLDAWISGAHLPERTVTLCGRPDLLADHEEADRALREAKNAPDDDRLGASSPVVDLAQKVRDLEQQIRASVRTFRVRSLTSAEIKEVEDASKGDELAHNDHWIASASVLPKMSVEQVRALRGAVGASEFDSLVKACLAAQGTKVTVPTSLAASSVLAQRDSSTT